MHCPFTLVTEREAAAPGIFTQTISKGIADTKPIVNVQPPEIGEIRESGNVLQNHVSGSVPRDVAAGLDH